MLRLLRKLVGASASEPERTVRPITKSATSEVLARSPRSREAAKSAPASSSLQKVAPQEFDPYNTGAFNRSASWERIGKRKL